MVVEWWFTDGLMVVEWWLNGGLMGFNGIDWWFNGSYHLVKVSITVEITIFYANTHYFYGHVE